MHEYLQNNEITEHDVIGVVGRAVVGDRRVELVGQAFQRFYCYSCILRAAAAARYLLSIV